MISFLLICGGMLYGQKEEKTPLPVKYEQLLAKAQEYDKNGEEGAAKLIYLEAINYLNTFGDTYRPQISDVYFSLAQLEPNYLKQVARVQEGLRALSPSFVDGNTFQNPLAKQVLYPKKALGLANFKIYTLHQYWRSTKGDEKYLKHALNACHFADRLIAKIRQDLGADRAEKQKQLPNFLMAYEQGMEIASAFFTETGESFYFDQAFYFAERNKSILLAENIASSRYKADENNPLIPKMFVIRETSLKKEIAQLELALQRAKEAENTEEIAIQEKKLTPLQAELTALTQQIQEKYPKYYALQYEIEIPRIEDIQALLDEETVIVEFSATDALSDNIYNGENRKFFIFTIAKEELSISKIPWSKDLNKEIVAYHKQLNKLNIIRPKRFTRFVARSHEFYRRLIRPINKYIAKGRKLIFIVEDQLNYLPFESLINKLPQATKRTSFSKLDFLLKYFDISYHYSTTLLYNTLLSERAENNFFGFAPVFSKEDSSTIELPHRFVADTATYTYQRGTNFAPLHWSELEVLNTAELFKNNAFSTPKVILRKEATKANLVKELDGDYDFIHIATHSFANLEYPELSGIVCHPKEGEATDQHILRMGEIYHFNIKANLVVLSSCESGYGELLGGEGMLGLNRAFVFAGTPNVMYSLWKVNDKITAQFMQHFFHQILVKRATYSEAVRRAKLKLLTSEESALPMHWMAFQLIGR